MSHLVRLLDSEISKGGRRKRKKRREGGREQRKRIPTSNTKLQEWRHALVFLN